MFEDKHLLTSWPETPWSMLLSDLHEEGANKVRVSHKSWFEYLILLGYFVAVFVVLHQQTCQREAILVCRCACTLQTPVLSPLLPGWVGWVCVGAQQTHALAQSGVTAFLDKQQARSTEAFLLQSFFSQHSSY